MTKVVQLLPFFFVPFLLSTSIPILIYLYSFFFFQILCVPQQRAGYQLVLYMEHANMASAPGISDVSSPVHIYNMACCYPYVHLETYACKFSFAPQ
jgi:hypothetical protein